MNGLDFDGVTVTYGRTASTPAVWDVSLNVAPGRIIGLVGESGCGKSSLAKTAIGLVQPSSGRVTIDGKDVAKLPRRDRPIQMVFQDPFSSLDPRMTIGRSIAEGIPRTIRSRQSRVAEVQRLLELVQLDPRQIDSLPNQLSGGQRQRVALARALAGRPRVVVADEMTSALDVSVQGAMLNLVKDVRESLGIGFLFISHDLAVVRYVCDEVAVMKDGQIVEHGAVDDVIDRPEHHYTQTLLAASGRSTNSECVMVVESTS